MTLASALIALLAIMAAALVWSGVKDSKKIATASDFLLHGENLGKGQLIGTLVATNLSLGNMIFVCAIFGYFYGVSGIFWMVTTIVILVFGFLIKRNQFKMYIEDTGNNFGTIHDYIARRHAPADQSSAEEVRRFAGIVSSISLFLALVIEVHLAGLILSSIFGGGLEWFVISLVSIVVVYSISGGFRSVISTDVIQATFLVVGIILGVFFFSNEWGSLRASGGTGIQSQSLGEIMTGLGPYAPVGLIVLGFAWLITTPDTWQRNCASRKLDTTVSGTIIGGAIMAVSVGLFAAAGALVKTLVEPSIKENSLYSNGAFPLIDLFLATPTNGVNVVLLAFVAAALIMAAISTMDTFLVVIAHVLGVDMAPSMKGQKILPTSGDERSEDLIFRARILIFVVGVGIVIAWYAMKEWALGDPVNLFFVTYSVQLALFVPTFVADKQVRSALAAKVSIAIAAFVTAALGLPAMVFATNGEFMFGLKPADWLAILPLVAVTFGSAAYWLMPAHSANDEAV